MDSGCDLWSSEINTKVNKKRVSFITCAVLLVPVLFLLLIAFTRESTEPFQIFPNDNSLYYFYYTDKEDNNGDSEIHEIERSTEHLSFHYILRTVTEKPFVGLSMAGADSSLIDLSSYDRITLKIRSTSSKTVRFTIRTFLPGYSNFEDENSQRYFEQEIPIWQNKEYYTFKLSSLKTPYWWYEDNRISEFSVSEETFSKVVGFDIVSGSMLEDSVSDTVTISEFTVYPKSQKGYIYLFILLYMLTAGAVLIIKRKKRTPPEVKKNSVIAYRELHINKVHDEQIHKIIQYLAANFSEANLTVDKISKGCGVSALKVPKCIKSEFGISVPEYLNQIRIKEAKRLLVETDRQILEIALTIGYNNASHFNRIFKSKEGLSPLEYRNNNNTSR